MAGHSHWAGIKHKKGRADKQRSKIFSKISKEITVAAKLGDKNPDMNPRLRSAIQSARSANMPKENIERAIDKSTNINSSNFQSMRYEGFGPKNIAIIIEALTNNKNRTAGRIRTILQKFGGNLGSSGSTTHFFDNFGVIQISKENISDEKLLDFAANLGAKDCNSYKNFHEIITIKEDFYKTKVQFEKKEINLDYSGIEWRPKRPVILKNSEKEEVETMLEFLEDDDDIQNVYHNGKFI